MSYYSNAVNHNALAMMTLSETLANGELLGLQGEALKFYVRAGKEARRNYRVAKVKDAVMAVAGEPWQLAQRRAAFAVALAVLDSNGVGGHDGTGEHGRNIRHPAFQKLGSGRRYGHDAGAWDEAIKIALHELEREVYSKNIVWEIWPTETGLTITGLHYTNYDGEFETVITESMEVKADESAAWVNALCRRHIRNLVLGKTSQDDRATLQGDIAIWGTLLNFSEEKCSEHNKKLTELLTEWVTARSERHLQITFEQWCKQREQDLAGGPDKCRECEHLQFKEGVEKHTMPNFKAWDFSDRYCCTKHAEMAYSEVMKLPDIHYSSLPKPEPVGRQYGPCAEDDCS